MKAEIERGSKAETERYNQIMKFTGSLDEQISKLTHAKMQAEQEKAEVEKAVVAFRRKKLALESRVRPSFAIIARPLMGVSVEDCIQAQRNFPAQAGAHQYGEKARRNVQEFHSGN